MVCIGVLASFDIIGNYSPTQYICSALVTFVFAEVLEGEFTLSISEIKYDMNLYPRYIFKCFLHQQSS